MQDLNDMAYFAEVAERGGFAAAGRTLGLPKSRLSRRIGALEARLGVRLLQRTTRKLSLTAAGELYLRHCVAVRDTAAAALEALAQVQAAPRGMLRIACPTTLAQSDLGHLIPRFLARHPLVDVELRVSNRVVDLVDEGVDVALRVRNTLDDSGSLVVKRLFVSEPVLVASPALLARQGMPHTPAELQRLDCVATSIGAARQGWQLTGPGGEQALVLPQPRYFADDLITLKHAVVHGTGATWLPAYLCRDELQDGRLVRLLPGWTLPVGVLHAVFPSRRGLVPAVRAFLDFLGEVFAEGGEGEGKVSEG